MLYLSDFSHQLYNTANFISAFSLYLKGIAGIKAETFTSAKKPSNHFSKVLPTA